MRPLIFERPELQAPRQRVVFGALTLAFWMLWVYLWLPVISLVAWYFGGSTVYREMVSRSGYEAVVELLAVYGAIVGILAGGLVLWALYNWARFSSRERRRALPALTLQETADRFRLSAPQLGQWQKAKRVLVHRSEDGDIVAVEVDAEIPRPSLTLLDTHGVAGAIGQDGAAHPQDAAAETRRQHRARAAATRHPR
jgi:biofilm PGA synthesis protein PgaD